MYCFSHATIVYSLDAFLKYEKLIVAHLIFSLCKEINTNKNFIIALMNCDKALLLGNINQYYIFLMEWNYTPHKMPQESGRYNVSILQQRQYGKSGFTYVADYDSETQRWFQWNPFADTRGDEISADELVAWNEGIGTALK